MLVELDVEVELELVGIELVAEVELLVVGVELLAVDEVVVVVDLVEDVVRATYAPTPATAMMTITITATTVRVIPSLLCSTNGRSLEALFK